MKTSILNIVKFKNYFLISSILIFFSCEKVVDINLNEKDPQIVIEGNINDQAGPYFVKLSQTVNYDQTNEFPEISGAFVLINDNYGNLDTLFETVNPGIYATKFLQGENERTYTLKVVTNGKEYLSTSTIHSPVQIDTLTIENQSLPMGNKKVINVEFQDVAGKTNYYRFIKIVNNVVQPTIYLAEDLTQDGEKLKVSLIDKKSEDVNIKSKDTITIVLESIDENVHAYFKSLLKLNSGGMINQSSTPTNPISNINNNALGYFNACSLTTKTIILP
ncbi:MAG: DUF4249 domain-containing protein [Flavobacteriia bacterium]|nr:DUF4249 domain-containing protein [Flavobacteriia bacterium]